MSLSQGSIFISYRRSDSIDVTGRIYDRLAAHYGKSPIFKDIDSIPYGSDFRGHIRLCVAQCRVLIAVIGPTWLDSQTANGGRRIDSPKDWVRVEIESALERNISLIPLLVSNAQLPKAITLPKSLQQIAYQNYARARPDPDFHQDLDRLIRSLDKTLNYHGQQRILFPHKAHSSHLVTLQIKGIEERLSALFDDYQALSAQLSYTENSMTKNNLKRQLAALKNEIAALETELTEIGSSW